MVGWEVRLMEEGRQVGRQAGREGRQGGQAGRVHVK